MKHIKTFSKLVENTNVEKSVPFLDLKNIALEAQAELKKSLGETWLEDIQKFLTIEEIIDLVKTAKSKEEYKQKMSNQKEPEPGSWEYRQMMQHMGID